jgi:hypothetical protein
MNNIEIICLESEALYHLVDTVVDRLRDKTEPKDDNSAHDDKWILPEEAMKRLGIKSKTTLQKLRDEGRVRFTQPMAKVILYDADSIRDYLDQHAKDPFA